MPRLNIRRVLDVLESNPSNRQLIKAFKKLNEYVELVGEEGDDGRYDNRVVKVCLKTMERHFLQSSLTRTTFIFVLSSLSASLTEHNIGLVEANSFVLPFIFDGFARNAEEDGETLVNGTTWEDDLTMVLGELIEKGSAEYRTMIFVRYYTQLQTIMGYIHSYHVAMFIETAPEFFQIVMDCPLILESILQEARELQELMPWMDGFPEDQEEFILIVKLFELALDGGNRAAMVTLLGNGCLTVAQYLKNSDSQSQADIFTRVLRANPEFRTKYISLTEGGTGLVAEVGRGYFMRKAAPADYIIYDENLKEI